MDNAGCWIGAFVIFVILAVLYFIIKIIITIVSVISLFIFAIPAYVLFGLYAVLEFISTNTLIALDKIFHPGFDVSPVVGWAFWGLVIGAAIQGYREMNVYGRRERGVLIALAPVVLLGILKLISPPGLGSFDVYHRPVAVKPPPPPPEPKDDHSDTRSGATSLSFRGPSSGRIDPGSDVDYFKVQVIKSGVLTVYTTGNLDTRGILQNSSGAILGRDFDDGSGNNFKIEQSLNSGTYYIKVESYKSFTGSYTMHASFREQSPEQPAESPVAVERPSPSPPPTSKDDHSDTRSGATSLSLGGSSSGRIDPGSDVDYFKVQLSKFGELTVYTTGNLDTEGELQNSSGATLGDDFDDGSGNNFKIEQSLNSGTYYIKVESYESSTGSYTMHASLREQSPKQLVESPSVSKPDQAQTPEDPVPPVQDRAPVYRLHLLALSNEALARKLRAELEQALGVRVYLVARNEHSVLQAGQYATRAEAAALKEQVAALGPDYADAYVVKVPASAVPDSASAEVRPSK